MRSYAALSATLSVVLLIPPSLAADDDEKTKERERLLAPCVDCHGPNGAGAKPEVPHLDGQIPSYLVESIDLLISQKRKSSLPEHVPAGWTSEQIKSIANYFGRQKATRASEEIDKELAARGKEVFLDRCESCHESFGRESDSRGAGSPLLAEQRLQYLQAQIRAYLKGQRPYILGTKKSAFLGKPLDINGNSVGETREKISEADADALAHFLAGTPRTVPEARRRRRGP